MASIEQPEGTVDNAGILSVGIVCNNDRCEIVMPIYTDWVIDIVSWATFALNDFVAGALTQLADCLSSSAYISHINVEPMLYGKIPARRDYETTSWPGTRSPGCEVSRVGALVVFYKDPRDVLPLHKQRPSKMIIPGIADDDLTGDILGGVLLSNVQAFADILQNGWPVTSATAHNWFRCYAAWPGDTDPAQQVERITAQVARGWVGTQRRRTLPH